MSCGFLLDTNIPSELTKPIPEPCVVNWVRSQENASFYFSVVSTGELRKGISLLPPSKRRTQLERWFEQYLVPLFDDRILPVTQNIADRWGVLSADCQRRGISLSMADGLIAATALEHDLIVATRNESDFAGLGVSVLNPWTIP